MTLELKLLALSIVLGLVQIVCCKPATRLCLDSEFTDAAVPALTGVAVRLKNLVETFQPS